MPFGTGSLGTRPVLLRHMHSISWSQRVKVRQGLVGSWRCLGVCICTCSVHRTMGVPSANDDCLHSTEPGPGGCHHVLHHDGAPFGRLWVIEVSLQPAGKPRPLSAQQAEV